MATDFRLGIYFPNFEPKVYIHKQYPFSYGPLSVLSCFIYISLFIFGLRAVQSVVVLLPYYEQTPL